MSKNDNWTLGLIDSAWFGSDYEGKDGREEAKRIGFESPHVHLSDCDGIHHGDMPPGRGNTPFKEYLAAIRDTGFIGAASIELEFPPDPRGMAAWVEEAYVAALQLLKDAGAHTA